MIIPLLNVTLIGRQTQKQGLIEDLQALGCLEIIPLRRPEAGVPGGASPEARDALEFLDQCPTQRRQEKSGEGFDPANFEHEVLASKNRREELSSRRDVLEQQLRELQPWGEFTLPAESELGGYRLWFYALPHTLAGKANVSKHVHILAKKDSRFQYILVVATEQPDMPLPPLKIHRSPAETRKEIDSVETELEELQIQRVRLTRWRDLFASRLDSLDDLAGREQVSSQSLDSDPVFAIRAWCPQSARDRLAKYAKDNTLAATFSLPQSADEPPTLLANPKRLAAGEGLVNFYMTPGYFTWDPSGAVLISFVIFFAMILADAGYAALIALPLLFFWRKMGMTESGRHARTVLSAVTAACLIYGILVGSYFGLTPSLQSGASKLRLLDAADPNVMMRLTVLIGLAHLMYANIRRAFMTPAWVDRFSPVGWVGIFVGVAVIWLGSELKVRMIEGAGGLAMLAGLLLIVLYTQPQQKLFRRLLSGMLGLTRITAAFGDVLSYLRLFALGLASASLAMVFNNLATQIHSAVPRIGIVLAILILLAGHGLNLLLSLMSGVIHGLRLNMIEFFNWALPEEGRLFRAFCRKETSNGSVGADVGLDRNLRAGGLGGDR